MVENIINILVAIVSFSFFYFVAKYDAAKLAEKVAEYKNELDQLKAEVSCNGDNIKKLDKKYTSLYMCTYGISPVNTSVSCLGESDDKD